MCQFSGPTHAALDYNSTIIGALELSEKKWVLAVQMPGVSRHSRHVLEACGDGLASFVERLKARCAAAGRRRPRVARTPGRQGRARQDRGAHFELDCALVHVRGSAAHGRRNTRSRSPPAAAFRSVQRADQRRRRRPRDPGGCGQSRRARAGSRGEPLGSVKGPGTSLTPKQFSMPSADGCRRRRRDDERDVDRPPPHRPHLVHLS